jgi:hypothetical protein
MTAAPEGRAPDSPEFPTTPTVGCLAGVSQRGQVLHFDKRPPAVSDVGGCRAMRVLDTDHLVLCSVGRPSRQPGCRADRRIRRCRRHKACTRRPGKLSPGVAPVVGLVGQPTQEVGGREVAAVLALRVWALPVPAADRAAARRCAFGVMYLETGTAQSYIRRQPQRKGLDECVGCHQCRQQSVTDSPPSCGACRLWAVHRLSVWCERITQNALFCVVKTARRLGTRPGLIRA